MPAARAEQLLLILIVEAAIGYPAALYARIGHPVSWVGRLIAGADERWNRGGETRRRAMGIALLLLLLLLAGGVGWAIGRIVGDGPGMVLIILIGTAGLAQRSLHDHVAAVLRPLAKGDVLAARDAVAMIVGRDTDALDEAGVSVAAIESLAESFCDGIAAPAFWFLVAGLPGLFACKAINTADSLVGHKDARHRAFGWASARADDLVNLIPARIAGLLICLAGAGGFCTMLRDAGRHASPNGGWPEAAMAGAIGRRLGGPVRYDGAPAERAWLGMGPPPGPADLASALAIYRRACLLIWLLVGGMAWLR
ncbi:cobalamin biosynthesis protein CobD [Sphingomonas oleivorans]|uniref:Cobalamin biosynthesis protein CobD n=1 Tax=Sphingomonas oleivorans TaxID=1735121 RepID=A0A2T5G282_9SPHN|nr:adenosylcobinamide-phosphate synthase CbiB [Sphingomonas oleivorans]PTQ13263.1 cobalamin biosynthesis protein CobD [Sphingomonas oleivorans]